MSSSRIASIDSAKGWGILLVLFGHLPYIPNVVADGIYAFHMPLFIFLAGLVWKPLPSFRDTLRKESRNLLFPFIVFYVLTYAFWLAKSTALGRDVLWWRPVVGLFYGIDGFGHWMEHNAVLWFLPFLFVLKMMYGFIWQLSCRNGIVFILAPLGFFWLRYAPLPLPWSLDVAMASLPFFALGVWAKEQLWLKNPPTWSPWLACVFLAVLGVLASMDWIPRMAWNGGNVKPEWMALTLGIAGTMAALTLSPLVSLSWIGKHSMILFALHLPAYSLLAAVWTYIMHRAPHAQDSLYNSLQYLFPFFTIAMIWPVIWILERRKNYQQL